MKIQLLIAACAALGTIALANTPAEYPVKEAADITKPAMTAAPAVEPAAAQPSDEELAKLKEQLQSIGQPGTEAPVIEGSEEVQQREEAAPAEQQSEGFANNDEHE